MENINFWLKKHVWTVVGVVLGAIAGYLYWRFVGCTSGTCPITSSPFMSTVWGALLGGSLLGMFEKKPDSTPSN